MKTAILIAAALAASLPFATATARELDQGWTAQQTSTWLDMSTGSRLLPLSWAFALEQPDGTAPFLSDAHLSRFGLPLRQRADGLRLPRGMAVDDSDDTFYGDTRLRWKLGQSSREKWVGLNCSGCHSADIEYQGQTLTIHAGATLADTMLLFSELTRALERTRDDQGKFSRFAAAVLGNGNNLANRLLLRSALDSNIGAQNRLEQISHTDLRGGPGRLDATGLVLNRMALNTRAPNPSVNPTDAPTSFPPLWNVPQIDRLQSSGFAPSFNLIDANGYRFNVGLLGGNVGVVVGDFGDVVSRPFGLPAGYSSSINVRNLMRVGDLLNQLKSPQWPADVLGAPDPQQVAQGRQLYADQGCAGCHAVHDRDDLETPIKARLVRLRAHGGDAPIGTDPWMACNTLTFTSATGDLRGLPISPLGTPSRYGVLGETAKIADMQATAVALIMLGKAGQFVGGSFESFRTLLTDIGFLNPGSYNFQFDPGDLAPLPATLNPAPANKAARKAACLQAEHPWLAYRARPLNGIWATAPYLHNGSVPSLYDLLLPPEQRPVIFRTGSRQLDTQRVGYLTAQGVTGNDFLFDTRLEGNSNAGHEFATRELSEAQRRALVEYLKTL